MQRRGISGHIAVSMVDRLAFPSNSLRVGKLGVALTALILLSGSARPPVEAPYRTFSVFAGDMEPALLAGDLISAVMLQRAPARGDVVIVRRGKDELVKRVAGLPGDRIGMTRGEVRLNGKPARYERLPVRGAAATCDRGQPPRMFRESLDPASRPTIVVDCYYGIVDDFPEVVVPAGHYFLLGDNRDLSADSRLEPQRLGLGMVPAHDIIGRALLE